MKALTEIVLPGQVPDYRGKVRDVYFVGNDQLLLVASDRLSAFDVVFSQGIPEKGVILTTIANHWFSLIKFVPNHLLATNAASFPAPFRRYADILQGRSVLTRRAERIGYECVVRGYLMGSAYTEYKHHGTVSGIPMPPGMRLGEVLPEPVFSPAVKNDKGHDENISFSEFENRIGKDLALTLRDKSLQIFNYAATRLAQHNLLLLDTKFEFGFIAGQLCLIDEVLTPDSSRFCFRADWEKALGQKKHPPTSDKQIIRDYLESIGWNKEPPAPRLPAEVIERTVLEYKKIQEIVLCLSPE